MRRHHTWLRRFYYVAIVLVTSVGLFTFVLSEDTERLFAWTIVPPLTAAFLGGNYWAAFFLALSTAREHVWANARLTYAVSVVFITSTMIATLLHLDKFNFDNVNGWLWTIVYVGVPPFLLTVIFFQLRLRGEDPPRQHPMPSWLFPLLAVQCAVVLVVGLALFLFPSTADELWPWELTPLTSRTVAAWVLALAAGLGATLFERDWRRIRAATLTFAAMPVFQFINIARYSDVVDWDSAPAWVYVAFLVSLLALGAYGVRRSWLS